MQYKIKIAPSSKQMFKNAGIGNGLFFYYLLRKVGFTFCYIAKLNLLYTTHLR